MFHNAQVPGDRRLRDSGPVGEGLHSQSVRACTVCSPSRLSPSTIARRVGSARVLKSSFDVMGKPIHNLLVMDLSNRRRSGGWVPMAWPVLRHAISTFQGRPNWAERLSSHAVDADATANGVRRPH